MKQSDREFWKNIYELATVGLNMVSATFIGLGMGWLIDHKLMPVFGWNSGSIFTILFLLFGIVAGFRNIIKMTRGERSSGDDEDKSGGPNA